MKNSASFFLDNSPFLYSWYKTTQEQLARSKIVNPPLIAVVALLYLSGFMCIWLSHIRLNVGHVLSWYIMLHYLVGLSGLEQTMTAKKHRSTHGILILKADSLLKIVSLLSFVLTFDFNFQTATCPDQLNLWSHNVSWNYIFLTHNIESHKVALQPLQYSWSKLYTKHKVKLRYVLLKVSIFT